LADIGGGVGGVTHGVYILPVRCCIGKHPTDVSRETFDPHFRALKLRRSTLECFT